MLNLQQSVLAIWLWVTLAAGGVWADAGLDLNIRKLAGDGFDAQGLRLALQYLGEGEPVLDLAIRRLRLGDWVLTDLHLNCEALQLFDNGDHACPAARVGGHDPLAGGVSGRVGWRSDRPRWKLSVDELRLERGGRLKGRLSGDAGSAAGYLVLRTFPVKNWLAAIGWSGAGQLGGRVDLKLAPTSQQAEVVLDGARLDFSDPEGLRAGEALAGHLAATIRHRPGELQGQGRLTLNGGHLYVDPIYLSFDAAHPLKLSGRVAGNPARKSWRVEALQLEQPGLLSAGGEGDFTAVGAQSFKLDGRTDHLDSFYRVLLQPWLIGTAADDLEVAGGARFHIEIADGRPRALALNLTDVKAEDGAGRFGVQGLAGRLGWRREGAAGVSRLGWHEAHLYRIGLGSLALTLEAAGNALRIHPFELKLLDGRLAFGAFHLSGLLEGALRWHAGARLEGVRLEALSQALGWPPLPGRLDADLPGLAYADDRLTLEGELVIEVFGGRVRIRHLVIESLLGVAPVLEADLTLENLDLAQISQAFSFGRISGSLAGEIRHLRLVGWALAGFEADLHSPADDPRPHRISQKAIDDLTRLGNGVAAGLSGTFLSVFKQFAYDRLALRVRLQGDRAWLDGAPGPKGGYYIVRGAGLPRVDVIGRNHEVAWKELLGRLRHIRFKGVVVK